MIQGLLPLIICGQTDIPLLTDSIDLIYKNDTGCLLLCLFKEVTHLGRAHTHEHLDEFRTGYEEEGNIRFPGDGSTVSPGNAAMISKPDILVIMIGKDGLADVSEESFINGYKNLIDSILGQSPSTKIICCSISSITEAYAGTVTPEKVLLANEWLKTVCTDKAVWYADTASSVCKNRCHVNFQNLIF